MKSYVGVKAIKAEPATRAEAHKRSPDTINAFTNTDQLGEDAGYVVEYADGYVSWSPASVFEASYVEVEDGQGEAVAAKLLGELRA